MTYNGFGYIVDFCPHNKTELIDKATRLNCSVDENGRSQYTCVPNKNKTALVEFCYKFTVGLYEKGNCLETIGFGFLDQFSCDHFQEGCPEKHFRATDLYRYPECNKINTHQQCYYADPSCPNTTGISTTNTSPNETEQVYSNVGAIVGGILLVIFSLFVTLAIVFLRERRLRHLEYKKISMKLVENEDKDPVENEDKDPDENEDNDPDENEDNDPVFGRYSLWKTHISDAFSKLTADEVSILLCFLSPDSGCPNFSETEWLTKLNTIRSQVFGKRNRLTTDKVQNAVRKLKSNKFLYDDEGEVHITEEASDETMYSIGKKSDDILFYISSFMTAKKYLRAMKYNRKLGEKCVISRGTGSDSVLIRRLQMNILSHHTIDETSIFHQVYQILNVPKNNLQEQVEFLEELRTGVSVHCRNGMENAEHVFWHWDYAEDARSNIVRSCIGPHPHCDIYIIDNKAYRKPSKYHTYPGDVRSLLYCLLLVDRYTLKVIEESHKAILNKLRERYFTDLPKCNEIKIEESLYEITKTQHNEFTFRSDNIRHDVMYAFAAECLIEDSDLEFFLSTASRHVILEYCRSWKYERSEGERCLYVPNWPEKFYNLFIDRLQIDVVINCKSSDKEFCDIICSRFNFPKEIIVWDKEAKEHYVENFKRGTQTVHHARGMIVGCAGAGKTTLLKRLLGRSDEEIRNVKPTQGLDVHEEIFDISDGTFKEKCTGDEINEGTTKTVTFFDFGGQCAYYACHQIYLTRRAFYILVLDASKQLKAVVDEIVCDQKGTVFSGWTYGDYFLFWLNSIHTYCFIEDGKERHVDVVIVATHWDEKVYKDKADLLDALCGALPSNSKLSNYIIEERCFHIQLLSDPIREIERTLLEIADLDVWEETIPRKWMILSHEIQTRKKRRILRFKDISETMSLEGYQGKERVDEMLQYYHDAGKVLYFNEEGLRENVIIDIQWFVDAFKVIIIDRNHVKGIIASMNDWKDYNTTGYLKGSLLDDIWRKEDEKLCTNVDKQKHLGKIRFEDDSRCLLHHKNELLTYMQKLGLLFIESNSLYIPCMNKISFEETDREELRSMDHRTSILVFSFEFLPYFLFCRLIVKLTQVKDWTLQKDANISCLYNKVAIFNYMNHYVTVAVSQSTIQVQIFKSSSKILKDKTILIRKEIENRIMQLTRTLDKQLTCKVGYSCKDSEDQILGFEVAEDFIEEEKICSGRRMDCPQHPIKRRHVINPDYLTTYWK